MITGAQYDAVLNFILKGDDKTLVTKTDINYGNKSNRIANTGSYPNDKMNNIYDLISNAYEVTTESTAATSRIYRGGGYDSSVAIKSASTKTAITPLENGMIIGSRMALYLLDSADKTAPTFSFETTKTQNTISVNVSANDSGVGVKNYYYSISETGEDGSWSEEYITTNNRYTFEGLRATTQYFVKVRVSDKMENISEYQTKSCTTNTLDLKENYITLEKVYGKSGQGVANLKVLEEYTDLGYYSIYQVIRQGETFNENGTWQQGNVITSLYDTDTIYAKLSDGTNTIDEYLIFSLNNLLETYSAVYNSTTIYTDENEDTAYIPAGFKRGTSTNVNKIEDGLVIEDESGNQFVWVPVPDAVYDETSYIATSEATAKTETTFYRPLARFQQGSNKYYEGMWYTFLDEKISYTTLNYRLNNSYYSEPRLVNNQAIYTWNIENLNALENRDNQSTYYKNILNFNSGEEFGKYMNEEYTNMVNSVSKYGGFYIARTETSLVGTEVKSQIGLTPKVNQNWYNEYLYQDSNRCETNPYYNSKSVVSSMIWNSQWSATINWIMQSKDGGLATKVLGNRSALKASGTSPDDFMNNVLDLSGNITERNLGGYNASAREIRGGTGLYSSYVNSFAGSIGSMDSTSAYTWNGTRMALYIVDEKDTNPPTVSIREDYETEITTNSIYVKLDVDDEGAGIKKYVYSISSDGGETYIDYTAYANTFKFENLTQNTHYKFKVIVEDHAGNKTTLDLGEGQTQVLEIVKSDIELYSLYGTDSSGVAYFEISDSLKEQNYQLEYQIIHSGETFNINGTWSNTQTEYLKQQVENLKVGDTVYARVTDSINIADKLDTNEEIKILNVNELETYGTVTQAKTKYTDINGDSAWIPAGFKVGTSSLNKIIENGLVIKHETTGDEFVWVPVEHAIYNSNEGTIPNTAANANKNKDAGGNVVAYKPMAKYQANSNQYFEGIVYSSWSSNNVKGSYAQRASNVYALGNTSYREPSLVTNQNSQTSWVATAGSSYDAAIANYKDILKFNSVSDLGFYLNDEYTNIVNSVDTYGGFWVGRYETSITNNIVSSQRGKTPMASINWYRMYYNQDSNRNENNPYYGNEGFVAGMISGSQYDAMLNWILEGKYADKVYQINGNHSGTRAVTGKYGNDYMNNILDLSSNVVEWTSEAHGASYRTYRGGIYYTNYTNTACTRNVTYPPNSNTYVGSRFTLYVK